MEPAKVRLDERLSGTSISKIHGTCRAEGNINATDSFEIFACPDSYTFQWTFSQYDWNTCFLGYQVVEVLSAKNRLLP
jgi:hypothetical protein